MLHPVLNILFKQLRVKNNPRTCKMRPFICRFVFSFLPDDCVCPRGNSYIRVDLTRRKLIRHTDDIRFEFKTTQSSSLLLYAMGRHRDFLQVKLVQGQLKFSVDLGAKMTLIEELQVNMVWICLCDQNL